jgi:tetratricopeptide (TPR) repeat protein
MREQERQLLLRHGAFAKWVGLKGLSVREATRRIERTESLRDLKVAYVAVDEAETSQSIHEADHAAVLAGVLLRSLPDRPEERRERDQLQCRALIVRGNCRRRVFDWGASTQFLREASEVGELDFPAKVRWYSISASLELDLGNLDNCLRLLASAEVLVRDGGGSEELGRIKVKEAAAYLACGRPLEALAAAHQAAALVSQQEGALLLLLRFITADSQLCLGRVSAALRTLEVALQEHEATLQPSLRFTKLQLQARILDATGFVREADKLFYEAAQGFAAIDNHRSSALVRLAMFQCAWQGENWSKAVAICQETIRYLESARVHPQMAASWSNLLKHTRTRAVTEALVDGMRQYVWRYWFQPAVA